MICIPEGSLLLNHSKSIGRMRKLMTKYPFWQMTEKKSESGSKKHCILSILIPAETVVTKAFLHFVHLNKFSAYVFAQNQVSFLYSP